MIASDAPAPVGGGASGDLGIVFVRQVFLSTAALLKVVAPLAFLAGAPGSFMRRSRGNALFDSAAADHAAAMQGMSWSEFEQLVEEAFRQRYAVSADTGRGPDGGADMILTNDTGQFLVQCKHGARARWECRPFESTVACRLPTGAAGGFVVTSDIFTPDAAQSAA